MTAQAQRLSDLLTLIAAREQEEISIDEIMTLFGDRVFGAGMLLFAAPNMLPTPPGTSTVLGAPLLFITFQLMIGRRVVWLPRFITARRISMESLRPILETIVRHLKKVEGILKPRLFMFTGPVSDRLAGLAAFLLTVVLVLPIPGGNMPPGFAITFFALGLVERDGAATLMGWLATLVSVGILIVFFSVIVAVFTNAWVYVAPYLGL